MITDAMKNLCKEWNETDYSGRASMSLSIHGAFENAGYTNIAWYYFSFRFPAVRNVDAVRWVIEGNESELASRELELMLRYPN